MKDKKCSKRFMLPEDDQGCIEHECVHYQMVIGTDPQTGESINKFMCADLLHNILLIENSKLTNEVGAAIESLRNEVVKSTPTKIEFIPSDKGKKIGHS